MARSKINKGNEVGYGKPPKHGRFVAGKSGNPKGRPKGSRNLASIYHEQCLKRVSVKVDGVIRTMTKGEAAITQLLNKAAAGDLRAMKEVVRLDQMFPVDSRRDLRSPAIHVHFVDSDTAVL